MGARTTAGRARKRATTRGRKRDLRVGLERLEERAMMTADPIAPFGSLVHLDARAGSFGATGETDTFTVDLDAGQVLTVIGRPGESGQRPRVELFGPGGGSLGLSDAPAAGQEAVVQSAAVGVAGTYRVDITSLAGAGAYGLDLVLNAAAEAAPEATGGPVPLAQGIEGSSVGLPAGADHLGVVGVAGGAPDFYSFNLVAGQPASVAVATGAAGPLDLALLDPSGTPVAAGVLGATNLGAAILGFVPAETGTYYARVGAGAGERYGLVVARGAGLEAEPNPVSAAAGLDPSGLVLGAFRGANPIAVESEPNDNGVAGVQLADLPLANDLSGSFVGLGGNEYRAQVDGTISLPNNGDWDFFRFLASPGDRVRIQLNSQGLGDPYLYLYDRDGNYLAADDDGGPGLDSYLDYSGFSYSGEYYIVADGLGSTTGNYRLIAQLTSASPLVGPDSDSHRFAASPGDVLEIATTTPFDGPLEPGGGAIDPLVELFGPDGSFLALDDNGAADGRNALLSYTVPAGAGGDYRARVSAGSARGAYTLRVAGSTAPAAALLVRSISVADGAHVNAFPPVVRVEFDRGVLLTSVAASDLTINGAPATGVRVVDGRTLEFDIAGLAGADGEYEVALAAGALMGLGGAASAEFVSTFTLDRVAPVVTSSSLWPGDIVPPEYQTFTFEFSEAIDPSLLGPEDVSIFNETQGYEVGGRLSYDPETGLLTVESSWLAEGRHRLTLRSDSAAFRDLAGNPLNGGPSFPLPSGEGDPAADPFVVEFYVDTDSLPIDYLNRRGPAGSLVYSGSYYNAFHRGGDADTYTVDLDAGQVASFAFNSYSSNSVGHLALYGPDGALIAETTGTYSYERLTLDAIPVPAAGTYSLVVSSLSTARQFAYPNSGETYRPIPASGTGGTGDPGADVTRSTIQVTAPASAFVQDVDVIVWFDHGSPTDLRLTLVSPQGTRILLSDRRNPGGSTYLNLTFDDESGTPIAEGGSSFGVYRPEQALAELLGEATAGAWTLEVEDLESGEVGTLSYWYLGITSGGVGEGSYAVEVLLNAGEDRESRTGLADNTIEAARPLDPYFIDLGHGADRSAVLGTIEGYWNPAQYATVTALEGSDFRGEPLYTVVDGYALDRGQFWQDGTVWWEGTDSVLEIQFSYATTIHGLMVQADNNDTYLFEYHDPFTGTWHTLWEVPDYGDRGTGGLVARPDFPYTDSDPWHMLAEGLYTDRIRFRATGGDGLYSVSEIRVLENDAQPVDYHALELEEGQSATLLVQSDYYYAYPLDLRLYDEAGTALAVGVDSGEGGSVISRFIAPAAGTYYVRVADGDPMMNNNYYSYVLVATRGADLGVEPASIGATSMGGQDITPVNVVLGELDYYESGDDYEVVANAGDVLVIETSTPADGPLLFENYLDPEIELYGPTGDLIATITGGAGDGRNVLATHEVAEAGAYTVRVRAREPWNGGPYVLAVGGATAARPFVVAATSPADGEFVSYVPWEIPVTFSAPIRLDSLDAGDLLVNGVAAHAARVVPGLGNTVLFSVWGVQGGLNTLAIAPGALTSLQNLPLEGFASTFTADIDGPRVVESSIMPGDLLPGGDLTFTARFSDTLADSIDAGDLVLLGTALGQYYAASSVAYDPETSTLTASFEALPDDDYVLLLLSRDGGFEDLAGNDLDGEFDGTLPSGDGFAGGDFTVAFTLDTAEPTPLAPLDPIAPVGSLVHGKTVAGSLSPGDQDDWTIDLDAGHVVSLRLTPGAPGLRGAIYLLGPDGSELGSIASGPGQSIILSLPAALAGTYTARVAAQEGAGTYEMEFLLDALIEPESYTGAANDDLASALPIGAAAFPLPQGGERLAVVGLGGADDDYYSFDLAAGQSASLALQGHQAGAPGLALFGPAGQLLALGLAGASNVDRSITDFVAPAAGTYRARVQGVAAGQRYTLVATRSATFETRLPGLGQSLDTSGVALGAIDDDDVFNLPGTPVTGPIILSSPTLSVGVNSKGSFITETISRGLLFEGVEFITPGTPQAAFSIARAGQVFQNNTAGGTAIAVSILDISGGDFHGVRITGIVGGNLRLERVISFRDGDQHATVQTRLTNLGGAPLADVAWLENFDPDQITATTTNDVVLGGRLARASNTNGTFPGGLTMGVGSLDPRAVVSAEGFNVSNPFDVLNSPADPNGARGDIAINLAFGFGTLAPGESVSGSMLVVVGRSTAEAEAVFAANAGPTLDSGGTDLYTFTAAEGDSLVLRTSTPGAGPGEPANAFDPLLELVNPLGFTVGTDDNGAADGRNALLAYTVPAGGAGRYQVRVRGLGQGSYVVALEGATPAADPAPAVVATTPAAGGKVNAAPAFVDVQLSEAILASSVQAGDLLVGGGATVTGVELLGGDLVRFHLDVPDVEGVYTVSLAAGAFTDLQGTASAAFEGSFEIDRTGPRVVAQSPASQASAPFTTIVFTFDEAIDPASVSTADIVGFTGPAGAIPGGQIVSAAVSGVNLTVTFAGQTARGTYRMTIGPDITDLVGKRLDQDGDGAPDTYTATIELQAPDLEVQSVSLGASSAVFGQTIDVTWTVRNTGSDPALENWSDRIYLSTDPTLGSGDVLLLTRAVPEASPLAVGGDYSRTSTVTLPLNVNLGAGTYYLIVAADALGQQPESSDANNTRASSALAITLPPLPDLVVGAITAPTEALAGQQIPISWTLTNQGTGPATGTWRDYVYLSADATAGFDQFFGSFSFTGTIAPGETITRSQLISLPINLSGDRWVVVTTDAWGEVYEHAGEANNTRVDDAPIAVRIPPLPDLQVVSVSAPPTAFSSQTTVVTWQVANRGTGATSSPLWRDAVYLSLDPVLDASDTFLGTADNPSFLGVAPGIDDIYTSSLTVTLPRGIDNNYYFIVVADVYNQVYEVPNEGNNQGVGGPTDVDLTPPPDLQVAAVNAPANTFSGQRTRVTWTVANEGPGRTLESAWWDHVYLSTDATYDPADTYLGQSYRFGALDPGASYPAALDVTLPIGLSGDYFLLVVADVYNQVYEHANEGNNTGSDATRINLTPPPDLEVELVSAPATALASHPLSITYRVANNGSTSTPNSYWTDAFYLSADATLDGSDLRLGTVGHSGALDPFGSYEATANFTLPDGLSGSFFVFVVADSGDVVFELDNANNVAGTTATTTVESRPADLVVTAASAPATAEAGTAVRVRWSVANTGVGDTARTTWTDRVVASADAVLGNADDVVLADIAYTHRVGSIAAPLPAGGSYSRDELVTLPVAFAGDYRLFVLSDVNNQVYEATNEGNNASAAVPITVSRRSTDLQVTAVAAPSAAVSGGQLAVGWTVRNLGAGPTNATYWEDEVRLSLDPFASTDDIVLGRVSRSGALAGLEVYEGARSFDLPRDLAGTYYVLVLADIRNHVFEADAEDNNTGASAPPTAITLGPVADLVVAEVDAPLDAISGQMTRITWTVRNAGPADAGGWWDDAVYLSRDQVFDRDSDIYLGYTTRGLPLAAGAEYTTTGTYEIPRGLSGPFYVFVLADSNNRVHERAGELNNANYDRTSMVVALAPPADLVVGTISVPVNAVPGQNATIEYTIHNQGTNPALGNWYDSVYISADAAWDPADAFLGRVHHVGDVAGGASYTETLTAAMPGVLPGNYHVIIRSDIRNHILESDEGNNVGGSLDRVALDAELLELGTPATASLATNQSAYYRVVVGAGETLKIDLDSSSAVAANELYVRYGAMPSRTEFDFSFADPFQADQSVLVPLTRGGTYYILAHGASVPGGPAPFSLVADTIDFSVLDVGPGRGSNLGEATVVLTGAKFSGEGVVTLVDGGSSRAAREVRWKDANTLWATFDLRGLPTGSYDVQVVDQGRTAVLEDSFGVTAGAPGNLFVRVVGPSALRPGQPGTVTVEYANTGETDIAAPVIDFTATNAVLRPAGTLVNVGSNLQFLAINREGPAGILSPGARGTATFTFEPTVADGQVTFAALSPHLSTEAIDWSALEDEVRPPSIAPDAWGAMFANFVAAVGPSVATYNAALAENATRLSQVGTYTDDLGRLLAFELLQANNSLPGSSLQSTVDFALPAPGLPLQINRAFARSVTGRHRLGPLGRGWTFNWDMSAATDVDGDVTLDIAGSLRIFERRADGTHAPTAPGDHGQLTADAGGYRLRETDGAVLSFLPDGKLSFIEDPNGNRVSATFTGDRLTGLAHSNGDALSIAYNAAGRIAQITDPAGRPTTYEYDASGEHLARVANPYGTTEYTYYDTPGLEHALRTATQPGGSRTTWEYDALGRVARQSLNGGAEARAFSYDAAGGVTITEADGGSSSLLFNDHGQIGQVRDALGNRTRYVYDGAQNLVLLAGPGGLTYSYTHDARGNLTGQIDALGNSTSFTYEAAFNKVSSSTDARGHLTGYNYDDSGNLLRITYPDGSSFQSEYDPLGNPVEATNRRGQAIQYTYNARGQATRKDFADGTSETFTYDSRGNLVTATDAAGTTTLTYDPADRLTRVAYPNGRSLDYTYDSGGRRTRSVDHAGFTINYAYDAAGRLARLSDASDTTIAAYTYDPVGRLARKDLGNGTYTTYAHDLAGQITRLENHAPGGALNSFFVYTYDARGNRTSVTTAEGTTSFEYDALSRLSAATLPGGRSIAYHYDAAGNRLSVDDDGAVTEYVVNLLDQYTQIGGESRAYDLDGNLVSTTDASGTTTYAYDPENRLVSVSGPAGSWSYEYDALGNRAATVANGARTEYLVDPTGLNNVVAAYSASGLLANFAHGLGLVGRFDTSAAAYYDFDALGTTVGLTGAAGAYLNTYANLPFGESISASETLSNPFRFAGQWGVMDDGNGLNYMRARYYEAAAGRFTAPDPVGLQAGDANLYTYAHNTPTLAIDPQGTTVPLIAGGAIIGGITGAIGYGITTAVTGGGFSWGGLAGSVVTGGAYGAVIGGTGGLSLIGMVGVGAGTSAAGYGVQSAIDGNGSLSGLAQAVTIGGITGPIPLKMPGFKGPYWGAGRWSPNAWKSLNNILRGSGSHGRSLWKGLGITNLAGILGNSAWYWLTQIIRPSDPNDIVGPEGFGAERWVTAAETLPYMIRFENRATATAPAQEVRIEQFLDPDLDWRTFRLGSFGFGDLLFEVPAGRAFHTEDLDLTAERGYILRFTAGIDAAAGRAFWILTTLDPETYDLPEDPTVGFLPPNDDEHAGEGFVTYTVRSKAATATGSIIDAVARIEFDTEAPIDTPPIFNTIDAGVPTSSVEVVPPADPSATTFLVRWAGSDPEGGSALAGFTIFVSEDGAPATVWLDNVAVTEAEFAGEAGRTYAFHSVARDNAGNTEPAPAVPDAVIVLSGAADTTPPDAPTALAISPDTGSSGSDGLTNTGAVSLSGSLGETGLIVRLFDVTTATDLGTAVVAGTTFSAALVLAEGPHRLRARAEDAAGNVSADTFLDVVVDLTAPALATGLAIGPDTGSSGSDGITGTGSVTLTGVLAEPGLAVALFDVTTGIDLGTAAVAGTGFSAPLALAEGPHRLRVRSTDAAGNATDTFLDVVIDLTAPASPAGLAISPDAGSSPADGLTNTGAVSLSGSLGESALVVALFDETTGTDLGFATVAGSSFTAALSLGEGSHRLRATAIDLAGNASSQSFLDVVVDLTRPTASFATVSPDPRATAVASVDFILSEGIDPATLGVDDLVLTRNGVPVALGAGVAVGLVSGLTYRVTGLSAHTATDGQYSLALRESGLTDAAGNGLEAPAPVAWLVDTVAPTSHVDPAALGAVQSSLTFNVPVVASDLAAPGGSPASGVGEIDVYVAVDAGPFVLWTTLPAGTTSAPFTGESNRFYNFRSVARDRAGNAESKPVAIEAQTYVPDLSAPETRVLPLASPPASPTFTLTLTGADVGLAGLASISLWVEIDGGAPSLVQTYAFSPGAGTGDTVVHNYQAIADGAEHTYRFFTLGTDRAGNTELAPAAPGDVVVSAAFAPPPALAVAGFSVQRGATQRSFLRHLDLAFNLGDELASILDTVNDGDATNDRLRLGRRDLLAGNVLAPTATPVSLQGRLRAHDLAIEIDFGANGIGGAPSDPAGDGLYYLDVDLDGDPSNGYESRQTFHRLLGDINGDASVDAIDVDAIDRALAAGLTGHEHDVNGDSRVNTYDRTLVRRARGRSIPRP